MTEQIDIKALLEKWLEEREVYNDCTVIPTAYYKQLMYWAYKLVSNSLDGELRKQTTVSIADMEDILTYINDEYKMAYRKEHGIK